MELGYFPGDNEFHCAAGQTVASPELGFLFPAFDDRAANIYNALFYSRKANEIHQEFIDAIFHVEAPMSAVEQKEAFQSALSDAFDCSLEVMQTVHEQLREKIKEHRGEREFGTSGDECLRNRANPSKLRGLRMSRWQHSRKNAASSLVRGLS